MPSAPLFPQVSLTSIDAFAARVGTEVGVSPWRLVAQADIDRFADATDDHQFIHVDPERARNEAPFGGTIAHGFLTLSLLPVLARDALPAIEGRVMGINYGFDRVRFVTPVRSGSRVRGRFVLTELSERRPAEFLLRYGVTVEIEQLPSTSVAAAALAADWLTIARMAR